MEKLPNDWLTRGLIDYEYKKYLLLAYLKTVNESFNKVELYPFLGDLVFHYRNLSAIRDNKALIRESFPREISLEEFKKLEINYKAIIQDDAVMTELESIIEFAIPRLKLSLEEGSSIYEHVEAQCEVLPIGVTPLYAREGYLFVTQPPERETHVYRYQVSIFQQQDESLRTLNTEFIEVFTRSLSNTYENLKLNLARKFNDLPNPAAYLILSKMRFPMTETLMPVAKRLFVRYMAAA